MAAYQYCDQLAYIHVDYAYRLQVANSLLLLV